MTDGRPTELARQDGLLHSEQPLKRRLRPKSGRSRKLWLITAGTLGFVAMTLTWEWRFTNSNSLVVYFGRPNDIPAYVLGNSGYLIWASWDCFWTALASLVLAGTVATTLLTLGTLSSGWLKAIEWLAATSQVVPFLVVVTLLLLTERILFGLFDLEPSTAVYSLAPVTLSLMFPPLVFGARNIGRTQIQLKSLLRLWEAPAWWRIARVYVPGALPDILTGLRTSATWAVGATLISDGLLDGVALNSRTLGHLLVRPFSAAPPGQTPTVIAIATFLAFAVYYIMILVQHTVERRLLGMIAQAEEAYSL